MKFQVQKSKVFRNLLITVGFLMLANLFSVYLVFYTVGMDAKITRLIIEFFNVDLEANLPTYFSALLLLSNSILLAFIAYGSKTKDEKFWPWVGMSLVFAFISLDEMVKIHEQINEPVKEFFNASGFFYYAWFIPYCSVLIILGIVYFKFMMRLPKRILKLFVLSAVIFLFGAVVIEGVSGLFDELDGQNNLTYWLLSSLEELMEMTGTIVFLYALIFYIEMKFKTATFVFGSKEV